MGPAVAPHEADGDYLGGGLPCRAVGVAAGVDASAGGVELVDGEVVTAAVGVPAARLGQANRDLDGDQVGVEVLGVEPAVGQSVVEQGRGVGVMVRSVHWGASHRLSPGPTRVRTVAPNRRALAEMRHVARALQHVTDRLAWGLLSVRAGDGVTDAAALARELSQVKAGITRAVSAATALATPRATADR